jgi:UDP-2-acetamido-3-amino-2,3-dideoxy-glucuronate N-acetyltransferase
MSNSVFLHPQGLCESVKVGEGTRIWAYAHVLSGATIGKDCNICDHVFIENDVVIGDRVTVNCGVQLWDGLRVQDDVFIGPNATFVNGQFPHSKHTLNRCLQTQIRQGASIGANATIFEGIDVGEEAMVEAGAVVTQSVPPRAIVVGNPAKIVGYTDTPQTTTTEILAENTLAKSTSRITPLHIGDVAIYQIRNYEDLRGQIAVAEFAEDLPFMPQRQFFVYGVPNYKVRGEHAHFLCDQFLLAIHGSLSVVVDNGWQSKEVRLDSPSIGLFLPKMTWGIQYKFSENTVLAVFASHPYDAKDYIRDYQEFLTIVRKNHPQKDSP